MNTIASYLKTAAMVKEYKTKYKIVKGFGNDDHAFGVSDEWGELQFRTNDKQIASQLVKLLNKVDTFKA